MHDNSRGIVTNQAGPHRDVAWRVARALKYSLRKPIAEHNRVAFQEAQQWLVQQAKPLILDAGCGVGLSTRALARNFPDQAVIGVDRSADRLSRQHGDLPENALLVRANLVDFWRLARDADWQPRRHYLLYPNPYPKAAHLKLRWHGHSVFPTLLALGGRIELRSNWRLYLQEFALAAAQVSGVLAEVQPFTPEENYLTPFERKYHQSGQALWRLVLDLPHCA